MKKQCFIYTEGISDRHIYQNIIDYSKFKYHTANWEFDIKNAHGCSPENILQGCFNKTRNKAYNKIICVIDLDVIKEQWLGKYKNYCKKLENKYIGINILWQEDNLEDELKKALGKNKIGSKTVVHKVAKKNLSKLVNSSLWNKLLSFFK